MRNGIVYRKKKGESTVQVPPAGALSLISINNHARIDKSHLSLVKCDVVFLQSCKQPWGQAREWLIKPWIMTSHTPFGMYAAVDRCLQRRCEVTACTDFTGSAALMHLWRTPTFTPPQHLCERRLDHELQRQCPSPGRVCSVSSMLQGCGILF